MNDIYNFEKKKEICILFFLSIYVMWIDNFSFSSYRKHVSTSRVYIKNKVVYDTIRKKSELLTQSTEETLLLNVELSFFFRIFVTENVFITSSECCRISDGIRIQ